MKTLSAKVLRGHLGFISEQFVDGLIRKEDFMSILGYLIDVLESVENKDNVIDLQTYRKNTVK